MRWLDAVPWLWRLVAVIFFSWTGCASCPNGAIVSRDELTVIAAGLDVAIDTISGYIDSETPYGRRTTPTERVSLSALKESRRAYVRFTMRVQAHVTAMFLNLLAAWFGCKHKDLSFPQSPRRGEPRKKAAMITGTYVVCLKCGIELGYDWKEMRITDGRESSEV